MSKMSQDPAAIAAANESEVCEYLSMGELIDILYLRLIHSNGIEFLDATQRENLLRIANAVKAFDYPM